VLLQELIIQEMMVCHNGMATMSYRTTFALDRETIRRLKGLAARWGVSQAEVVRRAIAQAERDPDKSDPVAMLEALHKSDQGLDLKKADAYLAQVHEDRRHWRRK
jgi:predicted DNA-binding protein